MLTISNDFLNTFFNSPVKGKVHRLFQRLFYIFKHPRHISLILGLIPSKLVPFNQKDRIVNIKYKIDVLRALNLSYTPSNILTNFYSYLGYIIYNSLNEVDQNFSDSLVELQCIFLKDQYCAQEFLKSDSVILDCGANIGMFSLWAHYLCPSAQIYSFEPTESTFEILEKNIKENNLKDIIHPFNVALGDKIQETKIRTTQVGMGSDNFIIDSMRNMQEYISYNYNKEEIVQMITIDDFVIKNKLERVDFIKMDTEGYEKQILKGAQETIMKFHPIITCSAYHLLEDKIEIPKLVLEIEPNYKYRLEKRFEEDFIFWYS